MVTVPELDDCALQLLTCLEDGSSPPEDKTDAYLRLAEDLAKEDKKFVQEICNFSARLLSVLMRDMISTEIDLSQAALQAIGYCIYQEQIVSIVSASFNTFCTRNLRFANEAVCVSQNCSLTDDDMSQVIKDLCSVIGNSSDKNLCTRALWSLGRQHLSVTVVEKKLPVILKAVEHALVSFTSSTVEKEALEVIYRLLSQLPTDIMTPTAGQWCKLVYPLLISSAHKIREKALGILELGLKSILLAREQVLLSLLPDLKGGLLSSLAQCFTDKKEIFVLRAWTILVTILGENLHKNGSPINEMLKIPEQGFKSSLPNVQNISYHAWISLIDNFALAPAFIGSLKKIKLLMMPLLLYSGKVIHTDIELGRLQAWWHLVCTIKRSYTGQIFSEVCIPLLQYFFNVNFESDSTSLGCSTNGTHELPLPVTPVARNYAKSFALSSPAVTKSTRHGPRRKSAIFDKEKFSNAFVKQVMQLGCEMLIEILAVDDIDIKKTKRLTEHLEMPILQSPYFEENEFFFLAVVKSALRSCANHVEDSQALSIWTSTVKRTVDLIESGNSKDMDGTMAPLFLMAHDIITCSLLAPSLILRFVEVLVKLPVKFLVHPFVILSSLCSQGKPIFMLADVLFNQLLLFKGTYVDERFHIVFESLIDSGLEAPTGKLTNVYNVWVSLQGLASSIANVEDLWRLWSKVTDSVSDVVSKTSDVNQGDSLEHDFSLMILLLTFPFKQLFAGGLPGATAKELDRDLAEFFRLFCRCASLVPTAAANFCIEELSASLVAVVSHDKCKNARFLDGICNLIAVMMDCVDFSSHNATTLPTPSTRGSLTPAMKTKFAGNPLGNLNSLVILSAKVLNISYNVDKASSGSIVIAPAVMVLAGTLSTLFNHLNASQDIMVTISTLSKPLTSFIASCQSSLSSISEKRAGDKKSFNAKFVLKIEKLWTDILMCLQSRYTAPFDSELLTVMSELLESTFCHPRRQFRNQTIMFWNATFAHADHLDYPTDLRLCLQTVLEKTPLLLPGWGKSKLPPCDPPATLQDSEETTPKENIIKPQVVMANSPKRKHGSSSPGKLKGSFLHKAFCSEKNDRQSPFKGVTDTSASKRKSPAGANVRRKLPLSLDSADDKDFVVIAPSPKKKRLLTEHQKEVRKEKKIERNHPVLYNMLDQSQDGLPFSEWSQSLNQTINSQNMKKIEEALDLAIDPLSDKLAEKESKKEGIEWAINTSQNENARKVDILSASVVGNLGEKILALNDLAEAKDDDKHEDVSNREVISNMDVSFDENASSPEFIPSSQTPESVTPFQSGVAMRSLSGSCAEGAKSSVRNQNEVRTENSRVSEGSVCQARDVESAPNALAKNETKLPRNTSPVSSRTRLKRKPTDPTVESPKVKTQHNSIPSERELESGNVCGTDKPTVVSSDEEHSIDPQLADTQILDDPPDKNCAKKVLNLNEMPSSPISNSIKFIHSKNSAVSGSPLGRAARGFNSPAESPTTGILKRNKGKIDTPSPPGKSRRVSFAFPLREEKEISMETLEPDLTEETKPSVEINGNFTSIKATPSKSSSNTPSVEDCVFPDLVECSTPVEKILPSLATSRWSRGLGHLVHAQNIRTVGNLSALTEDQVQKLPIRSPKVSTLRRVLRNFHETRATKSPKVNQRGMKTILEAEDERENVDQVSTERVNGLSEKFLANYESSSIEETNDSEELVTDSPVSHDNVCDVNAPSAFESELAVNSILSTPRRTRAQVKPTTLFESETQEKEIQSKVINDHGKKLPVVTRSGETSVTLEVKLDSMGRTCSGETDINMDICQHNQCVKETCEVSKTGSYSQNESRELATKLIKNTEGTCNEISPLGETTMPSETTTTSEASTSGGTTKTTIPEVATIFEKATIHGETAIPGDTAIPEEITTPKEATAADGSTTPNETVELREKPCLSSGETTIVGPTSVSTDDSVNPFATAIDGLVAIGTKEEIAELPINTLFHCHEQLISVLSNIVSAIKSRCG